MGIGTCLVTGGAGFIGSALSKHLANSFEKVVVIDNMHPQVHPQRSRPRALDRRVQLVIGDICDRSAWDKLLADCTPDTVLHLAAETGTGQSLLEASRHAHVNVTGTTQMLDAFARHRKIPDRILLTSSRAIYGEGAWRRVHNREIVYPGQRVKAQLDAAQWDFEGMVPLPFSSLMTEPRPISVYAATKLAQEHLLRAWAGAFGSSSIILRLQNVYGPGQSLHNPYTGICSYFARTAKAGLSIPVYEDGRIVRDFVYIDDVVAAVMAAVWKGDSSHPYDVGSGVDTTVADLAGCIAGFYRAPEPHVNGAYRHGDVRHASCTIAYTTAALGWMPSIGLFDGVAELCNWIDAEVGVSDHQVSAA